MTNVDIHAIVSTIEKYHIEQLFQFSFSNNCPVNGY
jgi:hypothetical protein